MNISPDRLPDTIPDGAHIARPLEALDVCGHAEGDTMRWYLLIPLRLPGFEHESIVLINRHSRDPFNMAMASAGVPEHPEGYIPEAGAFIKITKTDGRYEVEYHRPDRLGL